MNRAERRRQGIKQPPPKMKHISEDAYNNAINRAYQKGIEVGFKKAIDFSVLYMFVIPLLVLGEHFGEIRLKEYQGKPRVEHFFDLCIETYEKYNTHDVEFVMGDIAKDLFEKTGFDITKRITKDDTAKKTI